MRNKRESNLYYTWQKSVFKRDRYKCVLCGKKRGLNAHHIESWDRHPFLRYEVKNGVTLCGYAGGCHNRFHDIYGKGKNTRFQLDDFMRTYYGKSLAELKL